MRCKILSIDAWRGNEGGWDWNAWYNAGSMELASDDTPRTILRKLRDEGILSDYSKGRVQVVDDGYNMVVESRNNGQPLYAVEYGSEEW